MARTLIADFDVNGRRVGPQMTDDFVIVDDFSRLLIVILFPDFDDDHRLIGELAAPASRDHRVGFDALSRLDADRGETR